MKIFSERKAQASNPHGSCAMVGLADTPAGRVVTVRDSKLADSPVLTFTPGEWEAFLDGANCGEFDLDEDGNLPSLT